MESFTCIRILEFHTLFHWSDQPDLLEDHLEAFNFFEIDIYFWLSIFSIYQNVRST